MRTHHRAILLCTVAFGLVLPCGCAKKQNVPTTPVPLVISISQSPQPFTIVRPADVALALGSLGIPPQFNPPVVSPPANQVVVFHEQTFFGREGGSADGGHAHLVVAEETIYDWLWSSENDRTIQKAVAVTFAHEIGHAFLGTGPFVHVGSGDNVMCPSIDEMLPRLQQCRWPEFNANQRSTIRTKLGYPPD
jgi:hypothetical protein